MVWPTAEEAKKMTGKITMVDFENTYSYPTTDWNTCKIFEQIKRQIVLGDSSNFTIPISFNNIDSFYVAKSTLNPLGYRVWRTRYYPGYGDYRKDAVEIDY